jgi:hypothetical protein
MVTILSNGRHLTGHSYPHINTLNLEQHLENNPYAL